MPRCRVGVWDLRGACPGEAGPVRRAAALGGHVSLTSVILDAPIPCLGEVLVVLALAKLARSAGLRRATSTCVERESGWVSGDAWVRRTWGIPTVAGGRERGCVTVAARGARMWLCSQRAWPICVRRGCL